MAQTLVKQFNENLAEQAKALKARDTAAVVAHARKALDLIDGLEKLYA